MKDKKKITFAVIFLIVLILLSLMFFFIKGNEEQTIQETINKRTSAYETDLRDSMNSFKDNQSVVKYLVNWAENKSIDVTTDYSGNVIYSIPATENATRQSPTVIICGYNYKYIESSINSMVVALSVSKSTAEHGDLKVIFVCENSENIQGIENLSSEYFTDETEVFYLNDSDKSMISLSSGGYHEYTISKYYQQVIPTNKKAYQICIAGLPSKPLTETSVKAPNPIKELGNLLATFKSNYIAFELASFTGGTDSNITPDSAQMTIVINDDDTSKLEKTLNNTIEKFSDKYGEKYPDTEFTFKVTEMPSAVVNSDDSEKLVSLMYTILNGVYSTDEDDNTTAITNIGLISIESGYISLNVSASSYEASILKEISDTYRTISVLSHMDFSNYDKIDVFTANNKSNDSSETFKISYDEFNNKNLKTGNMVEATPCSIIKEKNKNMSIVALGITDKTKDAFAGSLILHMQP